MTTTTNSSGEFTATGWECEEVLGVLRRAFRDETLTIRGWTGILDQHRFVLVAAAGERVVREARMWVCYRRSCLNLRRLARNAARPEVTAKYKREAVDRHERGERVIRPLVDALERAALRGTTAR